MQNVPAATKTDFEHDAADSILAHKLSDLKKRIKSSGNAFYSMNKIAS